MAEIWSGDACASSCVLSICPLIHSCNHNNRTLSARPSDLLYRLSVHLTEETEKILCVRALYEC